MSGDTSRVMHGSTTKAMTFSSAKHGSGNDDKRRVVDATDIVRLIGDHLSLRQKGREYVGLCPFHDDHSPSMYVVPHKQIYNCFVCGAGGDAIAFVMNYHKMGFREALGYLAERAGVKLTPWNPSASSSRRTSDDDADGGPRVERALLVAANQTAATFYRAILNHPEHGVAARELVARRGISPEMVERFEIGAAPDMWDGLVRTIQSKGIAPDAFRAAGLLKARESGAGLYDSFRNRLIFPIHDQIGRVIAFGGRRINDEEEPKYLNSPESEVFNKSSTLYALHQAAQEIRRTRRAVVCEGYMDAIACHQAGLCNAVATLGTAMTVENARTLRRLCDQVVLLFDGDAAGRKAAERAVEVFFAEPIDVRIATLGSLTDAKDPDELLKRDGGRAVLDEVIARAADPLDVLFDGIRARVGQQGLSGRSRIVGEFLDQLTALGLHRTDTIRQQLIVKRLSQITGVEWGAITGEIAARRSRRRMREEPAAQAVARPPLGSREHLLGCVMCDPSLQHSLTEEQSPLLDPDAYAGGPMQQVARAIASLVVDEHPPTLGAVLSLLDEPEAQQAAIRLAREVERLTEGDAERLHRHWRDRIRDALMEDARAGFAGAAGADYASTQETPVEGDPLRRLTNIRDVRRRLGTDARAVPRAGPA